VGTRELAERLAVGRRNPRIDDLGEPGEGAAFGVTEVPAAGAEAPAPARGAVLTTTLEQLGEPASRRPAKTQPPCLRCARRPRIGDLTLCWACKRAFDAGGWR
jgi:hypothetical protein